MKRLLSITGLLLIATACSDEKPVDPGQCEGSTACTFAWDCSVGFTCGASGCCEEFGCTPTSCGAGQFCDEDFTCKSIADKCALTECECNIINSAGELEAVGSPRLAVAAGGSMQLQAVLAVKGGNPLPGAQFTFEAAGQPSGNATTFDSLFTVTSSGALTAKASAAGGSAIVEATLGQDVSCTAQVFNLGDGPSGGQIRAYVFDDTTGAPVEGAHVVFDFGNDGGADEALNTPATGVVQTSSSAASGVYTVSVFKAGYNYLSVVGLATATDDIALPIAARPNPPTTGGFTGQVDFNDYVKYVLGTPKTYHLGIVASSFPLKSILNFDLERMLGSFNTDVDCDVQPRPAGCYEVDLQPLVNDIMPLPGGLILSLRSRPIKPFFDGVGVPGRRYAWGIGGQLEISDIQPLIDIATPLMSCDCDVTSDVCDADCSCDTDCGARVNFGEIFNAIVPLIATFGSGVQGNLPLQEVPTSEWETYLSAPYADRIDAQDRFPRVDNPGYGKLSFREPLRRLADYKMPALPADPQNPGATMEGLFVLTGVNTAGYGYVPLGIGIGLDCTEGDCLNRQNNPTGFDGRVNGGVMCSNPDTCPPGIPTQVGVDHVGVFHASAHGGLQDQEWVTVVIALPISALSGESAGLRTTAFVVRGEPTNGLNDLGSRTYPSIATMSAQTAGRTYTVNSASDVDMHWVTVANDDTRWNIYFANPASAATFTAPAIPGALTSDPFAPDNDGEIDVTHSGFQLPAALTLENLAANNGTTLIDVISAVEGFSAANRKVQVQ